MRHRPERLERGCRHIDRVQRTLSIALQACQVRLSSVLYPLATRSETIHSGSLVLQHRSSPRTPHRVTLTHPKKSMMDARKSQSSANCSHLSSTSRKPKASNKLSTPPWREGDKRRTNKLSRRAAIYRGDKTCAACPQPPQPPYCFAGTLTSANGGKSTTSTRAARCPTAVPL